MSESIHDKIARVRPPKVHITYDVETEGAVVKKDLPFVVGVMGDFSGNPTTKIKPLRERKFAKIDRDNFNDVLRTIAPELNMRVENTLQGDGSEMAVQLKFSSLEDFEPANVVQQVEPLRKLLETRDRLRDLAAKVDRSDALEEILENILQNTEQLRRFAQEQGLDLPGQAGNDQGKK